MTQPFSNPTDLLRAELALRSIDLSNPGVAAVIQSFEAGHLGNQFRSYVADYPASFEGRSAIFYSGDLPGGSSFSVASQLAMADSAKYYIASDTPLSSQLSAVFLTQNLPNSGAYSFLDPSMRDSVSNAFRDVADKVLSEQ